MPKYSNHSRSLYNVTTSPGWTEDETRTLKLALMKYGVGQWSLIKNLGVLPGKTIGQFNLQTQRLLGQQALGGFMNLCVDVDKVRAKNEELVNAGQCKVKNGVIVNEGVNPTTVTRRKQQIENQNEFGLPEDEIDEIIPDDEIFDLKRSRRLEFDNIIEEYLENKGSSIHEAFEIYYEQKKQEELDQQKLQETLYQLDEELRSSKQRLREVKQKFLSHERDRIYIDFSESSEEEEEENIPDRSFQDPNDHSEQSEDDDYMEDED